MTGQPRAAGTHHLAIVGGGPRATYALERLSAIVGELDLRCDLHVRVFERTGEFGAGLAHSPSQPRSSYLNRISCQIGFAADPSTPAAGPLRPAEERPTLYEWCRRRYQLTGDPDFDLAPDSWPKRYVHGFALTDMFDRFAAELRAHPQVDVDLRAEDVVDIRESGAARGRLDVVTADGTAYPADEILLVTGHTWHDPRRSPVHRSLAESAEERGGTYVPFAYPLDRALPEPVTGPGARVGCAGTGLTAIDVILHLTEGRGGRFVPGADGELVYHPSGAEPATIVPFSPSGLFTFARPRNAKALHPDALEHTGVFLTHAAIDALRHAYGLRGGAPGGPARMQLDFERHVLPLIVLEMAYVHYRTLFGADVGAWLAARAEPRYRSFLDGESAAHGCEALVEPISSGVDAIAADLESVLLRGQRPVSRADGAPALDHTLARWAEVVFGPDARAQVTEHSDDPGALASAYRRWRSPWRLDPSPAGNRFAWSRTLNPVGPADAGSFASAFLDAMERDHIWAGQGNLDNPSKAATDGVWRDLRDVICYAVDDAGLTPDSHRVFADQYVRHHNRLANGAALEVMDRILALAKHGILDIGVGPGARVRGEADGFRVRGPATGTTRHVDVLVNARLHPFDPHADGNPLYRNLLAAGLVRRWRNEGARADAYEPGGLALTADFHPIRDDGRPEPRITVLGPAARGHRLFLMDALKPGRDHYVMRDISRWAQRLTRIGAAPRRAGAQPAPAGVAGRRSAVHPHDT